MQIAILGTLEVRDDAGRPVEIAGARLRTLLTRLAIDDGRWVTTAALVDAVWGDVPPADEANALQTLVSRLRRALGGPGVIASSPAGYRLVAGDAAGGSVDAARFESGVRDADAAARDGRPTDAAELLDTALALWRGPALADSSGDGPLAAEAARLEQLRSTARIERAELRAAAGTPDVAELEALGSEQPLNERLAVLLMRALAATGRQADALQTYEALRVRLADELGVDPSTAARAAHLELLRGETAVPPPTPSQRRSNLRAALTSFVGRDAEQQAIRDLLGGHRLVTLVGPGGAGKTRLASEAARGLTDDVQDGVWLAELAAVTSGADVAQAVLGSVGLRELHTAEAAGPRDAVARLTAALATRHLVIVLDNCEHVIDAAAELAETLLGECAGLRVLATSREPLAIGGESLFAVPPLPRPHTGAGAGEAATFSSVALFVERAAFVRPGFVLDDDTVGPVVEIVQRLDGLPLAIELAAARIRSMPLEDVAGRLSDRFRLLTGGSRTALPRHRTLRAVVEWSWDLLDGAERELVEQLAVFPAGITSASAAAVRPDGVAAADVPDALARLVDKSLLQAVGDGHRLRMLETIREYGVERLDETGRLDGARERHARHFAGLLREAVPHLTTRDQLPWFALLRAEQENALSAMRYFVAHAEADAALQLALDLAAFAVFIGDQNESAGWLAEALETDGGDPALRLVATATRVVATDFGQQEGISFDKNALGELALELGPVDVGVSPLLSMLRPGLAFLAGDFDLARRQLDESATSEDPWVRACSRLFATNLLENEGQVDEMRVEAAAALQEFRALGERWGIAGSLRALGQVRTLDGDLDGASAAYDESMSLMRELSSEDDTIFLLGELAELAMRRGDADAARGYLRQAVEQAERPSSDFESFFAWVMVADMERWVGSTDRARELSEMSRRRLDELPTNQPAENYVRSMIFRVLGMLAVDDGEVVIAREHAERSYAAGVATRDLPMIAAVGVFVSRLSERSGAARLAARQLGAADRLRGAADRTQPDIARQTATLQAALGPADFDTEYEAGRALGRDEAIKALDPAGER